MKPIAPLAIAGLVLCAAPLAGAQELIEGYTCCNLHYDKEWLSDANWLHAPMIPAPRGLRLDLAPTRHNTLRTCALRSRFWSRGLAAIRRFSREARAGTAAWRGH